MQVDVAWKPDGLARERRLQIRDKVRQSGKTWSEHYPLSLSVVLRIPVPSRDRDRFPSRKGWEPGKCLADVVDELVGPVVATRPQIIHRAVHAIWCPDGERPGITIILESAHTGQSRAQIASAANDSSNTTRCQAMAT